MDNNPIHLLLALSLSILQLLDLSLDLSAPLSGLSYALLQLDLVIDVLHLLQSSCHPLVLVLRIHQHLLIILDLFRACLHALH